MPVARPAAPRAASTAAPSANALPGPRSGRAPPSAPRARALRCTRRAPRPPGGGPARRAASPPFSWSQAVEHNREQRPIPEPGQGVRVDRGEELPRLRRSRTLGDDVLRPPDGGGGVRRENLVDDEPVVEHADRGQVLLHGRDRAGVGPDVGSHMERRDVLRLGLLVRLAAPDGDEAPRHRRPRRRCRPSAARSPRSAASPP